MVEGAIVATVSVCESELRQGGEWPAGGTGELSTRTLGGVVRFARQVGWLPSARSPEDDLFAALNGDVGDAVRILQQARNMATHPGRYVIEQVRPDFDDVEHMTPTYEMAKNIALAVLDKLRGAVNQ